MKNDEIFSMIKDWDEMEGQIIRISELSINARKLFPQTLSKEKFELCNKIADIASLADNIITFNTLIIFGLTKYGLLLSKDREDISIEQKNMLFNYYNEIEAYEKDSVKKQKVLVEKVGDLFDDIFNDAS